MVSRKLLMALLLLQLAAPAAWAQRKKAPSAAEIATAAKDFKAELSRRKNQVLDDKNGSATAKFTIALAMKLEDSALNDGIVAGQLQVSGFGKAFPDGTYIVFVCKVGKQLQAFAADGTKVVKSTTNVSVDRINNDEQDPGQFVQVGGAIPLVIRLRRSSRALLINFFNR